MTEEIPPEQRIVLEIEPSIEPGMHADFASIWHTPNTFVLDFSSLRQPPQHTVDEDTGKPLVLLPARVVARVKIPPEQVFELMKGLEKQLSMWEKERGRRPGGEGPDAAKS